MTFTPKIGQPAEPKQSFLRWLVLCPLDRCDTGKVDFDATHVWWACQLCGKIRGKRPREDVTPAFLRRTQVVEFDEPCSRAPTQTQQMSADLAMLSRELHQEAAIRHTELTSRLDPDYATNIERAFAGLSTPAPEEPYDYDPDDYPEGTDPTGDDRHPDGTLI